MKAHKKIKFFIARQIDTLLPQACWVNLVVWAIGYVSFWETFIDGAWDEKLCSEKEGYYCGKCERLKSRRTDL